MQKIILPFLVLCTYLNAQIKAQCPMPNSFMKLDMNNIDARVMNSGDMWWDHIGSPKYEYPKSSGQNLLFAGGIWLSAEDSAGATRVAAMQYASNGHDYSSGPINSTNGSITLAECNEFNNIWKITREAIQEHLNNVRVGLPLSLTAIDNSILFWPAKGNAHFTTYDIQEDLAPFIDYNNNGIYDPENGDYPHIKGDQALFWVMNDIGNTHSESNGAPLGVEIQCMAFSYSADVTSPLNDATFYEYKIINKTPGDLNDFYFGQFVDPDLGNGQDDYVGCDTNSNTGFAYNGDNFDEDLAGVFGYGTDIPMVSTTFLDKNMNAFVYYDNSTGAMGDPSFPYEYRMFQMGLSKNMAPILDLTGNPTKFMFSANPVSPSPAYNEASSGNMPGDRRFIQSSGPHSLDYMESFEITIATVAHPAKGNFDISVSMLPRIAEISQAFADSIYNGNTYNSLLNVTSVSNQNLRIYPNPVSNVLSVDLFTENQETTIKLLDINGRTVYQENKVFGGNSVQIDMTQFTNGIYFIHLESNGSTNHYKVVKANQP